MSEVRAAALAYSRRGWSVFPLHGIVNDSCTCGRRDCSSPGKHPLVRRGLHEATADVSLIATWWRRWRCANIGVATGAGSGIAVIDVDLPRALVSLERIVERLPCTLTALTGGGGLHLVYACDRALGNTTGRLPGIADELSGVDLRADGGYVVAPPSAHATGNPYSWLDPDVEPATLPDWIVESPRPVRRAAPVRPARFAGDGSAYGLHVLHEEVTQLARARPGGRNHELNRVAFAVAQVVAGGELLERPARDALIAAALRAGLGAREARLTLDSAFRAGSVHPRCAPHRLTIGEGRASGDAGPAAADWRS